MGLAYNKKFHIFKGSNYKLDGLVFTTSSEVGDASWINFLTFFNAPVRQNRLFWT